MSSVDPRRQRRLAHTPTSSDLVAFAYEAAADPKLWPSCFNALAESVRHRLSTVVVRGFGPTRYIDLRSPAKKFTVLNPGGVFQKKSLSRVSFAVAFVANEFVEDWSQLPLDGTGASGIELFGDETRALEAAEHALLRTVLPHLHRALSLHFELDELQRQRDRLSACFDELSTGMLLVDETAALVHTNRAAASDLDGRHGLVHDNGTLRATRAEDDASVRQLVKDATRGRSRSLRGKRLESGATLWVRGIGAGCALVVIGDDKPARSPSPALLADAFELTPAEGRVGSLFAAGQSVDEIASRLGISVHTVRLHLKKIQHRTGSRRQAMLMRRMLETVPRLHG